jgi:hypothetical protein
MLANSGEEIILYEIECMLVINIAAGIIGINLVSRI